MSMLSDRAEIRSSARQKLFFFAFYAKNTIFTDEFAL
jgi:hypothetical protein